VGRHPGDIFDLRQLFGEEPYIEMIEEQWVQEDWNIEEEEEKEQEQEDEEEEREEEENDERHEDEREEEWIDRCVFSFINLIVTRFPLTQYLFSFLFQKRPPPWPGASPALYILLNFIFYL